SLSVLCRRRPSSTLFPYTTLFRSVEVVEEEVPVLVLPLPRSGPPGPLVLLGGVVHDKIQADADLPPVALLRQILQIGHGTQAVLDRKSTRLNSSHVSISYAVFCLN